MSYIAYQSYRSIDRKQPQECIGYILYPERFCSTLLSLTVKKSIKIGLKMKVKISGYDRLRTAATNCTLEQKKIVQQTNSKYFCITDLATAVIVLLLDLPVAFRVKTLMVFAQGKALPHKKSLFGDHPLLLPLKRSQ